MKNALLAGIIFLALVAVYTTWGRWGPQVPDEKSFTADRIDCTDTTLDIRQVYTHHPDIPNEGIVVYERPNRGLQLLWHVTHDGNMVKKERFFKVSNGAVLTLTKKDISRELAFNFPIAMMEQFRTTAWKYCLQKPTGKPMVLG